MDQGPGQAVALAAETKQVPLQETAGLEPGQQAAAPLTASAVLAGQEAPLAGVGGLSAQAPPEQV